MAIGKYIRKSFSMFLDNPILVVPFLILGVLRLGLFSFAENYLKFSLESIDIGITEALLMQEEVSLSIAQALVSFALTIFLILIFLAVILAFVEAFSIGLVKSISSKKTGSVKDGLLTMDRGVQIFGMWIILIILGMVGLFVILVPATIIFGTAGALVSLVLLLIYTVSLVVISFFAPQSIVLEKKGPWEGILGSYKFIRKNLEGVVILLIFVALLFVCFEIIIKTSTVIGKYVFSEASLNLFTKGISLILRSLILAPYFIILKTYYFIKNKD